MAELTREEVLEEVREADRCHIVAGLSDTDLSGADLSGTNLAGADLSGSSLSFADLQGADLRYVHLDNANLRGANLTRTDLSGANLQGADLSHASLHGADLSGTDLFRANLSGAKFPSVNLNGAKWDGLALDGLHRYRCLLVPTPNGWHTRVGCWCGTVDELQTLIDGDDWPESKGEQITRYRPRLQMWIDLCRAHIETNPQVVPELACIHGGDR